MAEDTVSPLPRRTGLFLHISRISDERISSIEKHMRVGSTHRVRVTGSVDVEGWASVTLRPSEMEAAVLTYADCAPGMVLEGTVSSVEKYGLLVSFGTNVRGIVTSLHLSDVVTARPQLNRFKVGRKVTVRVLGVDAERRRLQLTCKKSLLQDEAPPLTSYGAATRGAVFTGFITRVVPKGVTVTFYDNVHGFVSARTLLRAGVEDPVEAYQLGQVVKALVLSADEAAGRLLLSLDAALGADNEVSSGSGGAEVSLGAVVSATVAAISDRAIQLAIDGVEGQRATMMPEHLADSAQVGREIAGRLSIGDTLDNLRIIEKRFSSGDFVVTRQPLLRDAALTAADAERPREKGRNAGSQAGVYPSEYDHLRRGSICVGSVSGVTEAGVFVRFGGRISGLAPAVLESKNGDDWDDGFELGDAVRCAIKVRSTSGGPEGAAREEPFGHEPRRRKGHLRVVDGAVVDGRSDAVRIGVPTARRPGRAVWCGPRLSIGVLR